MKKIFTLILIIGLNAKATAWFGVDVFSGDTLGLGIQGGSLHYEDFGWYGGIKVSGLSIKDSKISYNLAKNGFGDQERGNTKAGSTITAGTTYQQSDYLFFAGGIGFETIKTWAEFYDPFEILGDKGKYFTEKDSKNGIVYELRASYRPDLDGSFSFGLGYQSGATGAFISLNWIR